MHFTPIIIIQNPNDTFNLLNYIFFVNFTVYHSFYIKFLYCIDPTILLFIIQIKKFFSLVYNELCHTHKEFMVFGTSSMKYSKLEVYLTILWY